MYFVFKQNGTGGSPLRNANIAEYVIVRAACAADANTVAARVGVYFRDIPWPQDEQRWTDCESCEDRWVELPDSCTGYATREDAVASTYSRFFGIPYCIVVYEENPPRKVYYYVPSPDDATVVTALDSDRGGQAFYDSFACYWDDVQYMSETEREQQHAKAQSEIDGAESAIQVARENADEHTERDVAEAMRERRRADVWLAKLT
jgi:hypothetical protein